MKLRAVVVGIGTIAAVHLSVLETLRDTVEIVGLCDTDPARLQPYRATYPVFTDPAALCDGVRADVAHVCLPHADHLPAIRQLTAAGFRVFTEKPVTATADQADRLVELAARPDTPAIGVCFQNRYNPTFLALLDLLRAGTYGPVTFVRGTVPWARTADYYAAAPWRGRMADAGGGVMMNQAIHTLDQMLVVGGGSARTARGMIGNLTGYPIEVEDSAMARLRLANGADALFLATVAHTANESVELDVYCTDATLRIVDGTLTLRRPDGTVTELTRDTAPTGGKAYYGSGHGAAIAAFYDAVRTDSPPDIRVADAVPAVYAIDAIRRSALADGAEVGVRQAGAGDLGQMWTYAATPTVPGP